MKKMAEKIHHQFISGQINSAVFSYMQKIAADVQDEDVIIFDRHIKNLAELDVKTENDCQKYFNVLAAAPKTIEKLLKYKISDEIIKKLCKYALTNEYNFSSPHIFTKLALDLIKLLSLIKQSYPNNFGIEGDPSIKAPYNIDKWIETMRYIYDASNTNNLPFDVVAKKVLSKWDDEEKEHFLRWVRYYQEGNYSKYNVKIAQYFPFKQQTEDKPDFKPAKDLFDTGAFPKPDPNDEKKRRLDEARKKLRGRLKSIEELVEQFRDVLPQDIGAFIRRDIYDLKEKVHTLELRASIVDSIIRTSNQFNKRGFIEGARELKKIAQEVAEDKLPEIKKEPIAPVENVKIPELVQETPVMKTVNIPPVDATKSSIDVPNFNDISYKEAIKKLEEINSVISERAVVRALAGVDIMLAQLGIASYFVELSEAQSKMMDAFNYSSTRISNVISQLRGRSLVDIQHSHDEEDKKEEQQQKERDKKDTIETTEELNKPVGEVVSGPPTQAPIK